MGCSGPPPTLFGVGAPYRCSLEAAACCLLFMLTAALLIGTGTVLVVYSEKDTAFVHNRLALKLSTEVKSLLLERLDLATDGTLPEWDADRSGSNVQKADVVVTIISSGFASSKNVGFAMGNIAKRNNEASAGNGTGGVDRAKDGNSNGNGNGNSGKTSSSSLLAVVPVMLATSETSEKTIAASWPLDKVGGVPIPPETWSSSNPIKCRSDASDDSFDIVLKRLLFSICKAAPAVVAVQLHPPPKSASSHAYRRSVKVAPAPQLPSAMPSMVAAATVPAPSSSAPPLQRALSFKRRDNANNNQDGGNSKAPTRTASFRQRSRGGPSPTVSVDEQTQNIESIA